MGVNPTLAIMYAQTNLTARYSHDVAVAPGVALNSARAMAEELVRAEAKQVAKIDKSFEDVLVKEDEQEKNDSQSFGNRRRNRQSLAEESQGEDVANSENPFIGNLLNVKV